MGERIKHLREKAGLSQKRLAEILGIDQSAVARWETGENTPAANRIKPLADALGCTPGDLF